MDKNKILTLLLMLLMPAFCAFAQQEKEPSVEERAEEEAERLGNLLKLEDWQIFYVDSTLRYNYSHMMEEINQLSRSRVENTELYYNVSDKWMEANIESYKKIFTEKQYQTYLKSGGLRIVKDMEKRRQSAEGKKGKKK